MALQTSRGVLGVSTRQYTHHVLCWGVATQHYMHRMSAQQYTHRVVCWGCPHGTTNIVWSVGGVHRALPTSRGSLGVVPTPLQTLHGVVGVTTWHNTHHVVCWGCTTNIMWCVGGVRTAVHTSHGVLGDVHTAQQTSCALLGVSRRHYNITWCVGGDHTAAQTSRGQPKQTRARVFAGVLHHSQHDSSQKVHASVMS